MIDEERVALIEEACGVIGIFGHEHAVAATIQGLHALQHRGQESCGVTARAFSGHLSTVRRAGLVSEPSNQVALGELTGEAAIGHVRYSTSGESSVRDAQPLEVLTKHGELAVAHNGTFSNVEALRRQLSAQGSVFTTGCDTEVLLHLVARSEAEDELDALCEGVRALRGTFSLVGLTPRWGFAMRDAHGVRPLVLGRMPDGARIVASESSGFAVLGASFEREVAPGELLVIGSDGEERSFFPLEPRPTRACVFELVYFARADSTVFGREVYRVRRLMGERLAEESQGLEADVVIGVPDSGYPAALGFASGSGIPFEQGLVRSHYVGRTFIEPTSTARGLGVRLKLTPVRAVLEGKRVVIVDDSMVRGTTSRQIVRLVREAGASEVHLRLAAPPVISPCFYGIDTPNAEELIAARAASVDAIRDFLGVDSLGFLSLEGLREAVGAHTDVSGATDFCEACLTGCSPLV